MSRTDSIAEFANIPQRVHHLSVNVKLQVAQPGDREYKRSPRIKVFRQNPGEPEAFVIKLSENSADIRLMEGTFSSLMNREQFKQLLDYVKKYRVPLLNLWYRPGADIFELQDEIAAVDRGEEVRLGNAPLSQCKGIEK